MYFSHLERVGQNASEEKNRISSSILNAIGNFNWHQKR